MDSGVVAAGDERVFYEPPTTIGHTYAFLLFEQSLEARTPAKPFPTRLPMLPVPNPDGTTFDASHFAEDNDLLLVDFTFVGIKATPDLSFP